MIAKAVIGAAFLFSGAAYGSPITSCEGFFEAYDNIRKADDTLPSLFKDKEDSNISREPHLAMITGVRDHVGSIKCDENGEILQVDLDFNGESIDDEQEKRLALTRFDNVSVALIRAYSGKSAAETTKVYNKIKTIAAIRAHKAILRGDDEPAGEMAVPLDASYEVKMKITHEGPTLLIQHPGYDK